MPQYSIEWSNPLTFRKRDKDAISQWENIKESVTIFSPPHCPPFKAKLRCTFSQGSLLLPPFGPGAYFFLIPTALVFPLNVSPFTFGLICVPYFSSLDVKLSTSSICLFSLFSLPHKTKYSINIWWVNKYCHLKVNLWSHKSCVNEVILYICFLF